LRYTFDDCGVVALPANWLVDVASIHDIAVVGALSILLSTKSEMLSELIMHTYAYTIHKQEKTVSHMLKP
jgi:hypothetical protein